ncbi:MAG: hypothetical protein ABI977_19445 [Acidobacteriota bacterium]
MNTIQTTEYAVHLLRQAANGTKRWRAFVETLPRVTAEGESCEAVLEEIGRKLQMTLANGESATAPAASGADGLSPQELAELEAQVQAQGHKFYGIFSDDPGALEVFDEIERLRDQQIIANPVTSAQP